MRRCEPVGRFATEQKAAEAFNLELATFRHLVACRQLPPALPAVGLYDLKAIDAAFDRMSGLGGPANALDRWLESRNAR
jgi:hypothetical protein